jgi:peptidoglycan/LPS O-acetylase OafA/YrhL
MRLMQLDVLRALAVLLVIFRHYGPHPRAGEGTWGYILDTPHRCGWMGVDLFFVLSGFLVSGLLFREYKRDQGIRAGRFLIRRGLKIYPAFYVFLFVTVAVVLCGIGGATALGEGRLSIRSTLAEALFIQNYGFGIWEHTWSLAIEEHFYIGLALLFLLLIGLRKPDPFGRLPWYFVAIAGFCLLFRIVTNLACPYDPSDRRTSLHVLMYPTHLRVDALFFGVLLAYYYHFQPERLAFSRRGKLLILVGSLLLIAPGVVLEQGHFFILTVGLTGLYLGFGGILLLALTCKVPSHKYLNWLLLATAYIGLHSYSIYLWHVAVKIQGRHWMERYLPWDVGYWGGLALIIGASFAAGIVLAKLIEMPVLALRDRLFPADASATGMARPRLVPVVQIAVPR